MNQERTKRVCIAQISIQRGDMEGNLHKIRSTIERFRDNDLIIFPELVVHGHFFSHLSTEELAEEISHTPSLEKVEKVAHEVGTRVLLGSMEEREGKLYNVALYISPDQTQKYAKTHVHWTESFQSGTEFRVFETALDRIGPLICFDAAFPESSRILTLLGAKIIAIIAAVPAHFDEAVMNRRMSAIAVMNQVFVIYANRGGKSFNGGSGVWNPKGEQIARVGKGEHFLEVEIDLDEVDRWREEEPILPHRQTALYQQFFQNYIHS